MNRLISFIFLGLFSSTIWASKQELTLYFIPSPQGIDWSSPTNLAFSTLKNVLSFKPRFMGHVFVELKCQDQHELTGMAAQNLDYLNQLLIQEKGLGILYHGFEGRLEDKNTSQKELQEFLKNGKASFTRFELSPSQCQRAMNYLDEYRKNNVQRYYGLAHRPRYGEGAGCSAFGVSFLEVLNILDQEMKESWSESINIPLKFAGSPLTDNRISFLNLLLNAHSWAKEGESSQRLTFWSPDKMHEWVLKKVKLKQASYQVLKIENASGVLFNKSHFPAPEGPIWLQHLDPIYQKKPTN